MRRKMNKIRKIILSLIMLGGLGSPLQANEGPTPPSMGWSFKNLFGTFDRAKLQRGFQVYSEVCAVCHGLHLVRYDKLEALGYTHAEIKAIAGKHEVPGPLNDEGEPTKRKAEPRDPFVSPYPNEKAARAANNGAYPPDLSLIVKARPHGADYIYALLIGYAQAPENFQLMQGMHYNTYFPGHQIAMPAPLTDNQVTYGDGTKATVHQMASDLVTFLAWTAEPELEHRKQLGLKVMMYLAFFTVLMFFLMRKTWKNVK